MFYKKGVDNYRRHFIEYIVSVSYFRVPDFRKQLLEAIVIRPLVPIDEWRSSQGVNLDEEEDPDSFTDVGLAHMFDWQTYCYRHIDPVS